MLLAAYALYLIFLLKTHPDYFQSVTAEQEQRSMIAVEPGQGGRQPAGRVGAGSVDERNPRRGA